MKTKILFLIHDLGQGGAEKVLVNLVNNMDQSKFDITVTALFGGGVNEQFLAPHISFNMVFKKMIPGNTIWMKLFTPKQLHKICVKEHYDIEVSYLEGPAARIVSGCQDKDTKLVSWIHTKFKTVEQFYAPFRNVQEAMNCYNMFDYTAYVSADVGSNFKDKLGFSKVDGVMYNTVESDKILKDSKDSVNIEFDDSIVNLIAVGSLKEVKGYDRLLRVVKKIVMNNYKCCLYLLGIGPLEHTLKQYVIDNNLEDYVKFLGYDTNPYKYLSKSDLFVCSSYTEGFSTAATEALIVGTPVCTVDVSGMKEMLGENNEYGIVTENSEEALYEGIKSLFDNPQLLEEYKAKALERGKKFSTENTVKAVEEMLISL